MPPVRKESAPGNDPGNVKPTPVTDLSTPTSTAPAPGDKPVDPDVISSPDGVGLSAKGMQQGADAGYHDSLSGRAVDSEGRFVDGLSVGDEGPIPAHRIVANDWAQRQGSASRIEDPQAVDTERNER